MTITSASGLSETWKPRTGGRSGSRSACETALFIYMVSSRRAAIVAAENTAGVKEVPDHLCFVDTWSGFYVESPEDMKAAG
jgi:hypothetical protein